MQFNTIDDRLMAAFASPEYQKFTPFHPDSAIRLLGSNQIEDKLNAAIQMAIDITEWAAPDGGLLTELCEECYSDLYNFEQSAAITNPNYRGHLLHSCYVFLLGMYIVYNFHSNICNNLHLTFYDEVFLKLSKSVMQNITNPGIGSNEKEKFVRRWAIAALFHDTSYQTQVELDNINATANNLTGFDKIYSLRMSSLDQLIFVPEAHKIRMRLRQVSIPPWWHIFSDDILQILANRMAFRLENYNTDAIYRSLHSLIIHGSESGRWDHGLMGSIYFLRRYIKKLHSKIKAETFDAETLWQHIYYFYDVTDAAAAFALHNFKHLKGGIFDTKKLRLKPSTTPITCLLIMADELQWWNRNNDALAFKPLRKGVVGSVKQQLIDEWTILTTKLSDNPYELFGVKDGRIKRIPIPYGDNGRSTEGEDSVGKVSFVSYHHGKIAGIDVKKEWKSYSKKIGSLCIILDYCLLLKEITDKWQQNKHEQSQSHEMSEPTTMSVYKKVLQDELVKAQIHLLEIGHEGYPVVIENLCIENKNVITTTMPKNVIDAVNTISATIDQTELFEQWGFDIKRIGHLKQENDKLSMIIKKLRNVNLEDI